MLPIPILFIFGGLPACGKTTVARELAKKTGACHLRIDTLEQSLVRTGCCLQDELEGKGYQIACELAKDQLSNGVSVIADCVNPIELTRNWWRNVANKARCVTFEVEFICSDAVLHRSRAENRIGDIAGLKLPTWNEIQQRNYETWTRNHLVLDTSEFSPDDAVAKIMNSLTHAEEVDSARSVAFPISRIDADNPIIRCGDQ